MVVTAAVVAEGIHRHDDAGGGRGAGKRGQGH